jgi:hypothetical protein
MIQPRRELAEACIVSALSVSRRRRTALNSPCRPLNVDGLILILWLDLLIGDTNGFRRHLKKALEDAFRRGRRVDR